jgi:hypothetical protein
MPYNLYFMPVNPSCCPDSICTAWIIKYIQFICLFVSVWGLCVMVAPEWVIQYLMIIPTWYVHLLIFRRGVLEAYVEMAHKPCWIAWNWYVVCYFSRTTLHYFLKPCDIKHFGWYIGTDALGKGPGHFLVCVCVMYLEVLSFGKESNWALHNALPLW